MKVGVDYEDTEKVKTVIKLFESRWSLPAPKLLISVTGGAKDFHVLPDLLSEFKKGLMKAVKSTDAWVITGGTNTVSFIITLYGHHVVSVLSLPNMGTTWLLYYIFICNTRRSTTKCLNDV